MEAPIRSTKLLCFIAFNTLESKLCNETPNIQLIEQIPRVEAPLFVTYHINGDELRGCIGNLSPIFLPEAIPEYALISALEDSRFSPVKAKELKDMNVAVSLLVDFEECGALDWEVGKHGIMIRYKGCHATFLPEVAQEQGWDQRTTLQNLLRKGGYYGQLTDDMIPNIHCTRYESSKEVATWEEYSAFKKSGAKM